MPCGRFGGACAPFAPPWVRHWIEGMQNSRLEDNFHVDGLPIVFLG